MKNKRVDPTSGVQVFCMSSTSAAAGLLCAFLLFCGSAHGQENRDVKDYMREMLYGRRLQENTIILQGNMRIGVENESEFGFRAGMAVIPDLSIHVFYSRAASNIAFQNFLPSGELLPPTEQDLLQQDFGAGIRYWLKPVVGIIQLNTGIDVYRGRLRTTENGQESFNTLLGVTVPLNLNIWVTRTIGVQFELFRFNARNDLDAQIQSEGVGGTSVDLTFANPRIGMMFLLGAARPD